MAKIGRNAPCPCGSGKKYKKCHGLTRSVGGGARQSLPPGLARELEIAFARQEAAEAQRTKQQGLGRPIVSNEWKGHRFVAVGSRLQYSKEWRTFHDFLRSFLLGELGQQWFEAEAAKPPDRQHTIMRWYLQAHEDSRRLGTTDGGIITAPMTGAAHAFLNLAYNLYLIGHHTPPPKARSVLDSFVWRLKSGRSDDFVGKLFETYASAAFLKAGFGVEYENERDGTDSHVEFVATYPATGKKFSVEVKTRNPSNDESDSENGKRLRVGPKLKKALRKSAAHTRVVMIEVNIPDVIVADDVTSPAAVKGWPAVALEQIEEVGAATDNTGAPYPPAYVIVTNHPFHKNLGDLSVGMQALMASIHMDGFGPLRSYSGLREYFDHVARHREMFALMDSLRTHSEIPVTFDDDSPQLAFGDIEGRSRLLIGGRYVIPDGGGKDIVGTLVEAVVMEAEQKAYCIYMGEDGVSRLVTNDLSEAEMRAWRAHPDTFFGVVKERQAKAETLLDFALFIHKSYKDTPKDRLLDFMEGHPDLARLRSLPQPDLAITYAEEVAWSIYSRRPGNT